MPLSRKNYIAIAEGLNSELLRIHKNKNTYYPLQLNKIIEILSDHFERDNPRFSREKFTSAIYKNINP